MMENRPASLEGATSAHPIIWADGDTTEYSQAEVAFLASSLPEPTAPEVFEASVDSSYNPNYIPDYVNPLAGFINDFCNTWNITPLLPPPPITVDTIPRVTAYVPGEPTSASMQNIHRQASTGINTTVFNTLAATGQFVESKSPKVSKTVVLFENQRYSPISGWSSKSLTVTDRKAISTNTGSSSWDTFEEASAALLSYGWEWPLVSTGQWELLDIVVTAGSSNSDSSWKYSPDFNSYKDNASGSDVKTMKTFVRRRAYFRTMHFTPDGIYPDESLSCDHCDIQEVEKLMALLYNAFIGISTARYPSALRLDKAAKVKNGIINAVGLREHTYDQYTYDKIYGMIKIHHRFEIAEMGRKTGLFKSSQPAVTPGERQAEADVLFTADERRYIAKHIIRRFDVNCKYHCHLHDCGSTCPYATYECPHIGCDEKYAFKYTQTHDGVCPHKIVSCPREGCGAFMMRSDLSHHMADVCELRPVNCPYHSIGCNEPILCRDVANHILTFSVEHLELAMAQIEKDRLTISQQAAQIAAMTK